MNTGNLPHLLSPQSIVVVGASERNFYSANAVRRLQELGYPGAVHLVNPNHSQVFGQPCLHSISEVPGGVESALIAVGRDRVLAVLAECEQVGVKAAVVLASGFAERGDAEGRRLQSELAELGARSGLAICGPNCLGVINARDRFAAFGGHRSVPIMPGNIGVVSQSGANLGCIVEAAFDRGLGFSYLISSGNEVCLEASEYMGFMVDDDATQVICGFIESFRDPRRFAEVAERALRKGKPLIVIKIGRSKKASATALAHTGSLTGQDRVYDALFKQRGVIRASSVDDLLDRCSLFAQVPQPKWPHGDGLGVISVSGGTACLVADLVEDYDLRLPSLSSRAGDRLVGMLPADVKVRNPLELSGRVSRSHDDLWVRCTGEFVAQPGIDAVITNLGLSEAYDASLHGLASLADAAKKPIVLSSVAARALPDQARELMTAHHLPVVLGLERCLKAIKTALDYGRFRAAYVAELEATSGDALGADPSPVEEWSAGATVANEHETKLLLAQYGVGIAVERVASSAEAAIREAREIGYPVALKVLSREITHKTEAQGLKLNIASGAEVRRAYREILRHARLARPEAKIDGVLVQEMVAGVAEMYIGVSFDELGPLLLLGFGGTLVGLLNDVSARVAPISRREAEEMIAELKGYPLLAGYRGGPRADITALADALLRVSRLAVDMQGRATELDINPLIVMEEGRGVKAADALLVLRHGQRAMTP